MKNNKAEKKNIVTKISMWIKIITYVVKTYKMLKDKWEKVKYDKQIKKLAEEVRKFYIPTMKGNSSFVNGLISINWSDTIRLADDKQNDPFKHINKDLVGVDYKVQTIIDSLHEQGYSNVQIASFLDFQGLPPLKQEKTPMVTAKEIKSNTTATPRTPKSKRRPVKVTNKVNKVKNR